MSGYTLNGPDSMTPKHTIFFLFSPPLCATTSLPGVIKRPEREYGRLRTSSNPLRYVSWYDADWQGATYRCHTYAMTNVIKHSYSRRQFHGPVGAALMHVHRRQTGGHDKTHRRFSDYANAPTNVTKTQMVTMWSRHTIPKSTLPFR